MAVRYRSNLPLLSAFAQCLLTSHNIFPTISRRHLFFLWTTHLFHTKFPRHISPKFCATRVSSRNSLAPSILPNFLLFFFFFFCFFFHSFSLWLLFTLGSIFAVTRRILLKLTSYPFLSTPGPIYVMFLSYLFSLLLPFLARSTLPPTTYFNSHIVLNSTRAHACLSTLLTH